MILHGVATSPGSPVLLGKVRNKPVIGLPGYPVAAYLALEWFVRPLIDHWFKVKADPRPRLRVRLEEDVRSKEGREHFVRVSIGRIGDRYAARPLPRGAGSALSLARADGLLRIPARRGLLRAGEEVEAELLRPKERIDRTLWVAGGQDPVLELLVNRIRRDALLQPVDGRHRQPARPSLPREEGVTWRLFTWGMRGTAWAPALGAAVFAGKGLPPGRASPRLAVAKGNRGFPSGGFVHRGIGSSTGRRVGDAPFLDRLLRKTGSIPPLSTVRPGVLSPGGAAVEEGSADVGWNAGAGESSASIPSLRRSLRPGDPLEGGERGRRLLIELVRSDAFRAGAASWRRAVWKAGGRTRRIKPLPNGAVGKTG